MLPTLLRMQRRNIPTSIYKYLKRGPGFGWMLTIFLLVAATGCKKGTPEIAENVLEQYFELNILNNDFIVKYALDTSNNITSQYQGYVFRLYRNTLYDGPMTATKDGITYNGTWSSNEDYGKLVIALTHPDPTIFRFLNRQWRFTRKAIPLMELAPWGSTDPKVLHMERQ